MIKTRRMAALKAPALAKAAYAVLLMDLLGSGDSFNDFGMLPGKSGSMMSFKPATGWAAMLICYGSSGTMHLCACGACAQVACWRLRPTVNSASSAIIFSGTLARRAHHCCARAFDAGGIRF